MRHSSKFLSLAFKLTLTLAAFWLVARGVDMASLQAMLREQNHQLTAIAGLLIVVQIVLGALRWQLILKALSEMGKPVMPWQEALRLYYISVFFNCCLPGTVGGDVVRVWLARSDHVPLPLSINSVIIDRLIALMALALMVLATLPMLADMAGFDAGWIMALSILAAIIGYWLIFRLERLLLPYQHIAVARWLCYFIGSFRLLLTHQKASLLSLVYAIIAHVSYCLCAYVLAQSLSIDMTMFESIVLIPAVILAITLPVSIGGWGVRELSAVGMLALIGVPHAAALMLSVQLGLLNMLVSLPAGLLWLMKRKQKS